MAVSGKLLVGCVADDFTGATDVANIFSRGGLKATVVIGVPDDDREIDADAIVVALKTRTVEPHAAIEESLIALRWLRGRGADKFFFKYCSTFDSTAQGNIGPVADAMRGELGETFTIACPAFPTNARTIYKGNLFVGDVPLNESGMQNHPLTPMTDANLLRVLGSQTKSKVSGCYYETVKGGYSEIKKWFDAVIDGTPQIGVVDALTDNDLTEIARGFQHLKLFTGASGLAFGLTSIFARKDIDSQDHSFAKNGYRAVISGSCSVATNGQVAEMLADHEGFRIDVESLAAGFDVVGEALHWSSKRLGRKPLLFYATAKPDEVKANQSRMGVTKSGDLVERALAEIARKLVENGVNELIVAGGETSGAVVKSLGIDQLSIGNEIAPGVPWVEATSNGRPLSLALKSGNFGGPRFFIDAWDRL